MRNLPSSYQPLDLEPQWQRRWEESACFTADATSAKAPYVIVLPPPNVTGSLHMGHALGNTLQDVLCRWRRMAGDEVLWLPGKDHAGIATQTVVEKSLRKQGLERREMGRDAFLEHVWAWKETYGDRIDLQMRRHGSSLDWSRQRFTLDEGASRAVREAFVRLWEQGLIYREDRLVNWDPVSQTVLSDLEVEQEEEDGHLWHIAYPVDGLDEHLVVATTRPETLLGDVAVAIHPEDPRYLHLHGRSVRLPLTDKTIPIVTDPLAVDPAFGSGAVKITPGHDFNDFETGRRHGLPLVTVLDLEAKIRDDAPGRFGGMDRYIARQAILEDLRAGGLLVREEPYRFSPGRSQRSGCIVEPLSIGPQWFVRMESLAIPAMEAVRDGRIVLEPAGWERTYFQWMENIRDWCVSRQLWWGHRIPAWTCSSCGHLSVHREDPSACPSCGSEALSQDEDVLDTWFSSALWPFSTLGWPDDTEDMRRFYPGAVLETGFDILFFWVARMIMMGLHLTGDVPFRRVFLHAMVRDRHGRKMSKTTGNVIDPLHLIEGIRPEDLASAERDTYQLLFQDYPEGVAPQGADALRLTLAILAAAGRDIKLDVRRVEGYRAFLNKLWNASRFAISHLEGHPRPTLRLEDAALSDADRWILGRLAETIDRVNAALHSFRFDEAAQALYEFVWHHVCDWYIELVKPSLHAAERNPGTPEHDALRLTLITLFDGTLRLLHPFVPFITEEIWAAMDGPHAEEPLLASAAWPLSSALPRDDNARRVIDRLIGVTTAIRRIRGETKLPPGQKLPEVVLRTSDPRAESDLAPWLGQVGRLTKAEGFRWEAPDAEVSGQRATSLTDDGIEVCIPLAGLIDIEAERSRVQKELARAEEDVLFLQRKLNNPSFVANAPAAVVDKDREKLRAAEEAVAALQASLDRLDP